MAQGAEPVEERKRWMSVLARSGRAELEEAWSNLDDLPAEDIVRAAETGTILVEGRAGGTGERFNLGDATVTRCAVRIGEHLGLAYTLGRDRVKATLAAKLDALLQDPTRRGHLMRSVILPLERGLAEVREQSSRKAAATKVDFFTLVRGDE